MKTATISVTPVKFGVPSWLRTTIESIEWALFVQGRCEDTTTRGERLDGDVLRRIMAEADRMVASRRV